MSYKYEDFRPKLFTEDGVKLLTCMRRNAERHIKSAGAVRADKIMENAGGDSWLMLAAIDYMIEQGELKRVTPKGSVWAQYQVFTVETR